MKRIILPWIMAFAFILPVFLPAGFSARAAQPAAAFGSGYYRVTAGDEFRVGVQIGTDSGDTAGAYRLLVRYDASVLEYLSGADGIEEGCLVLTGETEGNPVWRMLEFRLLSDDSSWLELLPEGGAGEVPEDGADQDGASGMSAVCAPVLAVREDDTLRLTALAADPALSETFDAEQRVYHLKEALRAGEENAGLRVQAEAGEGIQVMLSDLTGAGPGRKIIRISLVDGEGRSGRYYLLARLEEEEVQLPSFLYEGEEWQILDSVRYAEEYLRMTYATATFSIDLQVRCRGHIIGFDE